MLSLVEKLGILDQLLHSPKLGEGTSTNTEPQRSTPKPWWDLLPQETRYKDTGCELFPSCLNCPLPRCVEDEPWGMQHFLQNQKVRVVDALSKQGMKKPQIAVILSVSTKTVQRYKNTYAARTSAEGRGKTLSFDGRGLKTAHEYP